MIGEEPRFTEEELIREVARVALIYSKVHKVVHPEDGSNSPEDDFARFMIEGYEKAVPEVVRERVGNLEKIWREDEVALIEATENPSLLNPETQREYQIRDLDVHTYDEKIAPLLERFREGEYLDCKGEYSFVMRTNGGAEIYVIPDRTGIPNNPSKVSLIIKNGEFIYNQITKLMKAQKGEPQIETCEATSGGRG
jgi:hypothetical protein